MEPVISFQNKSGIFIKTTGVRLKVIMKMTRDWNVRPRRWWI